MVAIPGPDFDRPFWWFSAVAYPEKKLVAGLPRVTPPGNPVPLEADFWCHEDHRRFVYVAPRAGDLLLWESWLRHEVTVNRAATSRVSVSFNYRL